MPLDDEYWSNRYETDDAAWDVGIISTPLKEYIDQLTDKNISILIPGCGNSYEAAYLLQQGFTNITVVDISSTLCKIISIKFAEYIGKGLNIVCGDFFELNASYHLVLEQTFFCAFDTSLRNAYAKKMHQLLKPGGKIVGVLFNREFEGGPPFGGSEEEYRKLFQPYFTVVLMEACYNSILPRKGKEIFVQLIR